MSVKGFDWFSGLVGFVGVLLVGALGGVYLAACSNSSDSLAWGAVFCFDGVSFFMVLLSILLWLFLFFWLPFMSLRCFGWVSMSVLSSILCYCCIHSIWFWVFYEVTILCLFFLLVVESPYSERYLAGWYFLGYILVSSLPMLVSIYYLSACSGSFDLRMWESDSASLVVLSLLGILFITKIPLFPFHVWLPIVHAEASSPVSVCLSGYVMKLGLLGVYRFCGSALQSSVFSNSYLEICLGVAILFFCAGLFELDGKRWLAFMSLSHIVVAGVVMSTDPWGVGYIPFVFSVGHGLSAGATFGLLWYASLVTGSRNWLVLKDGVLGGGVVRSLYVSCLCTVASLPPSVQFFCEVLAIVVSGQVSVGFSVLFACYLFCSSLVPLFIVGILLSRRRSLRLGSVSCSLPLVSIYCLVVWCFVSFLVL